MQLRDGVVLLFEMLYTVEQRNRDFQTIAVGLVIVLGAGVVQRALHLADGLDKPLGLFRELMLLLRNKVELVVECL